MLDALRRKNKLTLADGCDLDEAARRTEGYSGAELEAVLLAAAGRAMDEDRDVVEPDDLLGAVEDVIPSRDARMLEFMEMLAVFESSSRRMLPDRFRSLTTDEVHRRLDELRGLLGRRV
ncbi:MAG: hypothetical protein VX000_10565 [Myxococcota bacterium]|nr:hypothetical protein [Myxococcota bacterium]